MGKYVYPAVFTPEEAGKYSVYFPDIDGCYTCGDDLADGMEMAEDALTLMLTHLEDEQREILLLPQLMIFLFMMVNLHPIFRVILCYIVI